MDHTIIKEAATKIVANIKAMEDDITVLRNKQDIISTSDTTMTGSYPGRLSIEEIGGKCEQFTTTGAQLFDISTGLSNNDFFDAVGIAYNTSGIKVLYIPCISNETYSVSVLEVTDNTKYFRVACVTEDKAFINRPLLLTGVESGTFVTPENCAYLQVAYDIEITKAMVNAGNTPLPYEPYTGGQPSPNPDYPQEIKKTVVSEIKTHGKNLLENIATNTTNKGITLTVNADKSVTLNGTANEDVAFALCSRTDINVRSYILSGCPSGGNGKCTLYFEQRRDDKTSISGGIVVDSGNGATGLFVDECKYIWTGILVRSGFTANNLTFYPMIRSGEVEDPTYEPYTESTITLSQPIELYGIGDVKDTIEDGKVVRRFAETVLNGNENWVLATNGLFYYPNTARIKARGEAICDQYIRTTTLANPTVGYFDTAYGQLRFAPSTEGTVEEWIERVTNNPITVVYELTTPVTEELPLVDQIALNSLSTYDGITYVEFDSEIEPTLKAEYGATKLGGYTLEGILAGANGVSLGQSNTDRITALEATLVNNI